MRRQKLCYNGPFPLLRHNWRFLGLTGFVKKYDILAEPLTTLLQKAFHWFPEAQVAFDQLKQAMSNTPVLTLADFTQPFCIETEMHVTLV